MTLLCAVAAIAATSSGAANPRTTTVMTINIYQGSELEHALAATGVQSLVAGVTADYANVPPTSASPSSAA